MLRSILAIVAGYVTMAVIVIASFAILASVMGLTANETPPTNAILLGILAGFFAAIVGGMTTACLAPKRPYQHVIWLIGIGIFMGLASMAMADGKEPFWVQLANLGVMVVGLMIGGQWIRIQRKKKRA